MAMERHGKDENNCEPINQHGAVVRIDVTTMRLGVKCRGSDAGLRAPTHTHTHAHTHADTRGHAVDDTPPNFSLLL
jgi:hypothetical protein